jgi:hypothetical protein
VEVRYQRIDRILIRRGGVRGVDEDEPYGARSTWQIMYGRAFQTAFLLVAIDLVERQQRWLVRCLSGNCRRLFARKDTGQNCCSARCSDTERKRRFRGGSLSSLASQTGSRSNQPRGRGSTASRDENEAGKCRLAWTLQWGGERDRKGQVTRRIWTPFGPQGSPGTATLWKILDFIGATRRIRTDDLLITNHLFRYLMTSHETS